MPYVVPRPGSRNWYYREAVPADVEAILIARTGKKPSNAMKSLRTTDKREAERRVVAVRARQHEEWDEIRTSSVSMPNLPSPTAIIEAVTAQVHQGFLRVQQEKLREELVSDVERFAVFAAEKRRKRAQVALLPSPEDLREMEKLAAAVARAQSWSLAPGTGVQGERWEELVTLVTKAVQLARSDLADLMDGKDAAIEQAAVVERLGGRRRTDEAAAPGETIMSLFDRYEREKLREGKRPDTIENERKVLVHFAGFVGENLAVNAVTRSQIRDFKQALSDVPHRWTTVGELSGMKLADAAKTWRSIGGNTRSVRTINKEISAVSAFFSWLKRNVYVEENVALGFRSKVDKAKSKYPPYRDRELVELFNSPLFVGCDGRKAHKAGDVEIRDWRYWLPICLLYSGARTGEIIQLECNDIRTEHDVWIFDLVESNDDEDKRLKNLPSRRIVPIHQTLIEAGFLDYVEKTMKAKHSRVFPEVQPGPRGDWSYKPSKFWASYLKHLGMKRKGLCLHSFRHTFTDECRRRGVDESLTSALLGHANHTQTGHYGSIPVGPLMLRKEAIDSLKYGDLRVTKS